MTATPDWFPAENVDADLVARATSLRPLLEANATACETDRRITDDNIAALDAADLLDIIVPKRNRGHGATFATQLAVSAELARACASTAWVQTLLNATTWAASLLPDQGQADIFDPDRPARVCGVLAPTGTATPAPGGYTINGKWGFASGCLHANWAAGGVIIHDNNGNPVDQGMAYIPIDQLTIEDTWHVTGMRGTGSNTLVANNVHVPAHRVPGALALLGGTGESTAEPEPSDRWPIGSVLALILTGPLLGMAQAALDAVTATAPKRAISYTTLEHQTDSAVVLREIAHAALDIETARLHIYRSAADVDFAGAGHDLDYLGRARLRGACGYATETLRSALNTLVNIAGASAFADSNPLQRYWRDLNVASRHAFLATNPTLEVYARAIYNLDNIMLVV